MWTKEPSSKSRFQNWAKFWRNLWFSYTNTKMDAISSNLTIKPWPFRACLDLSLPKIPPFVSIPQKKSMLNISKRRLHILPTKTFRPFRRFSCCEAASNPWYFMMDLWSKNLRKPPGLTCFLRKKHLNFHHCDLGQIKNGSGNQNFLVMLGGFPSTPLLLVPFFRSLFQQFILGPSEKNGWQ